jgi:SSS family solute:Na+ symporter
MHWVDWAIVAGCLLGLTAYSLSTIRYMQGVADFLSANRSAGRYLLTIASGMSGTGAISVVAMFEMYYAAGFPPLWWSLMSIPVSVVIILTGWVYYRFRQTRCLTMAQFYEVRYSRPFRIYAGIVTWVAGILNFGIFPAVASRFFVYFCGFPPAFEIAGFEMPTFIPIMIATLGLALAYTCLGGQITVMVTDCVQGIVCGFTFIIVCMYLLYQFGWNDITVVLAAAPENASMIHPYKTDNVADFNFWFFAIGIFGSFYGYMSWQGSQAYQSSGLSPHEQKMGQVIGLWRGLPLNVMLVLMPVCAFAFVHLPQYAEQAAQIDGVLDAIPNEQIARQMTVPVILSYILPLGMRGLFCAVMIFFLITTQDTYLHSWGSIFIQDVVMPFRKKKLTARQHVWLLRLSIGFVAAFAFVFSIVFRQTEHILMFMAITGAIVGGLGAVIVGGLYWKHGSTTAAYVAMTIGWVMAVARLVAQQFEQPIDQAVAAIPGDGVAQTLGDHLCVFFKTLNDTNSQWVWLWIMLACIVSYIAISLLSRGFGAGAYEMDRMLHRGAYAIEQDQVRPANGKTSLWWKVTGITPEFTRTDRWLAAALVLWNGGWFAVFLAGTLLNWHVGLSDETWSAFWHVWIYLNLGLGIPATIWFTVGGVMDIRKLFARLATLVRDERDDGSVTGHHMTVDEGVVIPARDGDAGPQAGDASGASHQPSGGHCGLDIDSQPPAS